MHDIKKIRENSPLFDVEMKRRGVGLNSFEILALDERRRKSVTKVQELQKKRNEASKKIGVLKQKGLDSGPAMDEVVNIKNDIRKLEDEKRELDDALHNILSELPNILSQEVPDGIDENDNREIRRFGVPNQFSFKARDHVDIGQLLQLMDFERAAKLSGARFVVLRGMLSRLERALANMMLDHQVNKYGYTEISPPFMVNDDALYGTAQLPKFSDQQFRTSQGLWLIPTSEVPLTNMVAEEILLEEHLPIRFTAYTPCFRSEAGAAGRDTRGMIRVHQFGKVEMVSIAHPDNSVAEHERMTECAEDILKQLNLPYRTVLLCSGDTGFSAQKTYDIEVWLPGQNNGSGQYREISSCSLCGDFQARRMKTRFQRKGEKQTEFVHTLNGSGLAVGRTLIAIMENYQKENGSVAIPEVLKPYMDGLEVISF